MPKKIFFLATILLVVFFIPKIVSANVVINEIAWMGTENSANDEWIELYNDNGENIDLSGWILEAVDGSPLITLEGTISANGYFLLERTDDTSVPDIIADQIYTGVLGNTGESLKLKNNSDNIIDEINATDGWPAGNKITKQTMEKTTTGWQTSLNSGGTPKAQNSSGAVEEPEESEESTGGEPETPPITIGNNPPVADAGDNIIAFIGQEINFDGTNSADPDDDELAYSWNMGDGKLIEESSFTYKYSYPGTYLVTLMVYDGQYYVSETITVKIQSQEITINEFIPNPEGADEENEWIEIYNDSNSIVDISGWQLDDEASGSQPFVFPQNTLIAPKNYLVFARPITKIALNNDGDSVRLLLPEGIVFQEITYEDCEEGQSSAHTEEGFVWSVPTPGMANIMGPEINMGIGGEEIVYDYQIEPQITKESTEDYSWYFEKPEQEIEGGFIEKESNLAGAFPLTEQEETNEAQGALSTKGNFWNQNNLNLILMILALILAAIIIGLSLTKFRKKFP